jgi:hypothetical protein
MSLAPVDDAERAEIGKIDESILPMQRRPCTDGTAPSQIPGSNEQGWKMAESNRLRLEKRFKLNQKILLLREREAEQGISLKDNSVALGYDERFALKHDVSLREVITQHEARCPSTALSTPDSSSAATADVGEDSETTSVGASPSARPSPSGGRLRVRHLPSTAKRPLIRRSFTWPAI